MRFAASMVVLSVLLAIAAVLMGGCAVGRTANDEAVYGIKLGDDPSGDLVGGLASAAGGAANLVAPGSGSIVTQGIIGAAGLLGIGGATAAARNRGQRADAKQAEADEVWDRWAETNAELEAAKARIAANAEAAIRGGA